MADIGIKNYMEDAVMEKLPIVMKQMNVCECDNCRMDILAFVLNKLPPKYVVTIKGTIFAKLSVVQAQFEIDILTYLTQAATMVKERPRHGDET